MLSSFTYTVVYCLPFVYFLLFIVCIVYCLFIDVTLLHWFIGRSLLILLHASCFITFELTECKIAVYSACLYNPIKKLVAVAILLRNLAFCFTAISVTDWHY